jgi:hypothetical protein
MTVYKTKYYNYVLILAVVLLNCLFNLLKMLYMQRLNKDQPRLARDGFKKTKSRFHEDFNFERQHGVSYSVIFLVGVLDMTYAFLLFWPANGFPIWLMVSLLQFYIPLSIFIRYLKMGL